jgi:hypothetical protein
MFKLKKINIPSIFAHLAILILTFSLVGFFSIDAKAQNIGVKPFNEKGEDRGVFRYITKPGEKIDDIALVVNSSDFDGKAIVLSKDSILDTSGSIAFLGNEEENKLVGNWIEISQREVDVPAKKGLKVPFTVNVPADTKAGEYTAGIVVTPSNSQNTKSGVAVSSRSAITVYITVQGDLKIDNKVSDFSVINPKQENFATEVDKRGFISPENMSLKFKGENLGNIYSRLSAKVEVQMPDGETKKLEFKRNFNLGNTDNYYYINTNLPYKIGTTKVKMDYTSQPYNFDQGDLDFSKSQSSEGSVEYSFTLIQEDLNGFNSIQSQLIEKIKKEYQPQDDRDSNFVVKEEPETKIIEVKKEDSNDSTLIIIGSIIIFLLLAFIVYFVINQRKSKKSEEEAVDSKNKIPTKTEKSLSKDKPEVKREVKKTTKKVSKNPDIELIQDDYKPSSTKKSKSKK